MRTKSMWLWIMGMVGVTAGVAWLFAERSPASAGDVPMQQSPATGPSAPMDRSRFWAIIDRTTALEADTDAQAAALRAELNNLTPADIEAFESTFDQIMQESYSWDLWGATYVIHGGASDDGFEYFRVWLISKGRTVYEAVLKDPDSLAERLAADSSGPLEFEEFAYVARTAWEEKTGRDGAEMPTAARMIYPNIEPAGQPFEEDSAHLSERYPKLWKRFGNSPAQ